MLPSPIVVFGWLASEARRLRRPSVHTILSAIALVLACVAQYVGIIALRHGTMKLHAEITGRRETFLISSLDMDMDDSGVIMMVRVMQLAYDDDRQNCGGRTVSNHTK